MDALAAQIRVLGDEINAIRTEIVQSKQAHASLHQSTVDDRFRLSTVESSLDKMQKLVDNIDGQSKFGKPKKLIEPKEIVVPEFAGAVSDTRAKFLTWAEKGQRSSGALQSSSRRCTCQG